MLKPLFEGFAKTIGERIAGALIASPIVGTVLAWLAAPSVYVFKSSREEIAGLIAIILATVSFYQSGASPPVTALPALRDPSLHLPPNDAVKLAALLARRPARWMAVEMLQNPLDHVRGSMLAMILTFPPRLRA